jgi:radical SAM protein with 4Fe4S-binding SPASM domain
MLDVQANHFQALSSYEDCAKLFSESVTNVIIEISRHCNRSCDYCPVAASDRASSAEVFPENLYESIIRDLAKINYSQSICLNLYNEPSADRALLLKRIQFCREVLPDARIYFSSNGDYLTEDYIHAMVKAGLSELYVTLHLAKSEPYSDASAISRFTEFSARLGKPVKIHTASPNHTIQGNLRLHGLPITVFSTNYMSYGSDRAGSVASITNSEFKRTSPCNRPYQDFTISYNGIVFPCCQMFADNPEHTSNYAIGNISEYESIFHAYASSAMAGWRRDLLRESPKMTPCESCTEGCYEVSQAEREQRDALYKEYVGPILDSRVINQSSRLRNRIRSLFSTKLV